MSFKLPPFLIKKIFPPKKAVATVDTTSDGKADCIKITALNVIQPFTIPKTFDLGDFDFNDFDLSEYGEIQIDNEPIDISSDIINFNIIKDRFSVYHKGEKYSIDDILDGKMGGKLIAMGDSLTILIKLEESDLSKLTKGKHIFKIEAEGIPNLEIGFELTNKNMNVKLDYPNL